jgi:prevent-host-death family protein
MTITLSAMEARQKFGEILNRVDLVHDQFIIERNGRPLAAIVPISSLEDIQKKSRKRALSFLESRGSDLSDEEANAIAVAAVKEVRAERRKKKAK